MYAILCYQLINYQSIFICSLSKHRQAKTIKPTISFFILYELGKQILINFMLHTRIKSTGPLKYPQPNYQIQKKRIKLSQYNRQKFSNKSSKTTRISTTAALSPQMKSQSRILLKHPSQTHHRFHSSFQMLRKDLNKRPATCSLLKCYDRQSSPLSVIRNRSQHSNDEYEQNECSSHYSPPLQNNFLKKGTSVDKMIIKNVLKSKLNTNMYSSVVSYTDATENSNIVKIIEKQIPGGLKDIVGVEEMLKMTHIITGMEFKTVNIKQSVNKAIKDRKAAYYLKTHAEDDEIILKSIQRW